MANAETKMMFQGLQGKALFFSPSDPVSYSETEILMTDYLYRVHESGALQQRKYVLTRTRLIEFPPQNSTNEGLLEGDVRWCTIEPRVRYTRLCVHWGFAIIYKDREIIFYAASDTSCDLWLRKLGSVAILRNIESAYLLGKIRESHKLHTLFDGFSIDTGEQVTVKQIHKFQLLRSPRRYQSLSHEIQILRSISHPLLAKLYHVYESDDSVYLVFERLEGTLLSDSINERRFTEHEATGFVINLLTVLVYLEEKSILHRDFRPCNFLLTTRSDRSQFKIINFSIAREYGHGVIADSLGSPGFIAPEVLNFHHNGPAADIYSAGILIYMLITGKNPFEFTQQKLLLLRNAKSKIPFGVEPCELSKLSSLVRVMTSANPESRLSASRLRSILQKPEKTVTLPQVLSTAELRRSFDLSMLKWRDPEKSQPRPPSTPFVQLVGPQLA